MLQNISISKTFQNIELSVFQRILKTRIKVSTKNIIISEGLCDIKNCRNGFRKVAAFSAQEKKYISIYVKIESNFVNYNNISQYHIFAQKDRALEIMRLMKM